jgi:hypothetical protein
MLRRFVAALVAMTSAAVSQLAWAQADPFADYEAMKQGQTPPPAPTPPVPVATEPSAPHEPSISTSPWEWTIGGRGTFSFTGISNETLRGDEQSNTALFFRLAPVVGLTVHEKVLLTASFGLLANNLTREDGRNATAFAGLLEFTGHYMMPLTRRLVFMPGVGLGVYSGSNDRALVLDGRRVTEYSSTVGFAMSGYALFGYMLTPQLEARTGIALYGQWQSESVENENQTLSASAGHIGVPIEIHFHL